MGFFAVYLVIAGLASGLLVLSVLPLPAYVLSIFLSKEVDV